MIRGWLKSYFPSRPIPILKSTGIGLSPENKLKRSLYNKKYNHRQHSFLWRANMHHFLCILAFKIEVVIPPRLGCQFHWVYHMRKHGVVIRLIAQSKKYVRNFICILPLYETSMRAPHIETSLQSLWKFAHAFTVGFETMSKPKINQFQKKKFFSKNS